MKKIMGLLCVIYFLSWGTFAHAGGWRFDFGVSYLPGLGNLADFQKEYRKNDVSNIPFGIMIQPRYQATNGNGFGLEIDHSQMDDFTDTSFIPTGHFAIYKNAHYALIGRVGFAWHVYDDGFGSDIFFHLKKSFGLFAAARLMFLDTRAVAMGAELYFDSTKIEMRYCTGTEHGECWTSDVKEYSPYAIGIRFFFSFHKRSD